jgi:hypothetical protein
MSEHAAAPTTSTVPSDSPRSSSIGERIIHAAAFSAVGLVVLLGSVGLLGVRTGAVSVSGGGYTMEVTHAVVTRPGLATPFRIDVVAGEGTNLPDTVVLEVDADYLAAFDFNGLQPTPSASFSRGRATWWTFDVPPGQSGLRVEMDARLEPAVQWARRGAVRLVLDGDDVATAEFTTWVLP